MALKHVNAVVVGAGAGGGVVAKELSTAGLTVAVLERGKWYSAADCRKDDLRNQRITVLGNAFGPDDERNPRVAVDERGEQIVYASEAAYSNNAACVGGGTFSYGAMAWRYLEKWRAARSKIGRYPIPIWSRTMRRPSGRWAYRVTTPATYLRRRDRSRCPCRRYPPTRST